jgi:hypothetical protein
MELLVGALLFFVGFGPVLSGFVDFWLSMMGFTTLTGPWSEARILATGGYTFFVICLVGLGS